MSSEHHDPHALDDAGDADLTALLAQLDDEDLNPSAPPELVWDRVAAQIAADRTTNLTSISPTRDSESTNALDGSSDRTWRLLAVAAALLLVVGGITTWLTTRPDTRVVATAQLEYETGFDQAGSTARASAELIERDGDYLISLQDSDLPGQLGEPADLALWLIEADPDGNLDVQPVAVIDRGDGTYSVPAGLDPETHNIVDISIEPRDGNATHSGRSILRGTLVAA